MEGMEIERMEKENEIKKKDLIKFIKVLLKYVEKN